MTNEQKNKRMTLETTQTLVQDVMRRYKKDVSVKILGDVESLSLSGTYEKNNVINCAGIIYISTAAVTGLPTNIVTHNGQMVTDDGEVVIHGENTETKWKRIAGRPVDNSPIAGSDSLVTSGGVYPVLSYLIGTVQQQEIHFNDETGIMEI